MSTATSGRAREHRVSKRMQEAGWLQIMRAAGSKGPADLAMLHPFIGLAWVQVGTANKRLSPFDRDRLCAIAEQTGALPLLASCAPGVPPTFWVVTRDVASKWERWSL